MQLEDQRIPFDLSLYKTVPFSFINPTTYEVAREILEKQVNEAIAPDYKVDNPVTRALGQQNFEQTASPAMKVIADQLESMTARLLALEKDGGTSPLAGVVSHLVTLYVDIVDGIEQLHIGHAIKRMISNAEIVKSGENRLVVRFRSTKRGAFRMMQQIDEIAGVINCSTPILQPDQGNLF